MSRYDALRARGEAAPQAHSSLNRPSATAGGSLLPSPVRGKMERAFGHSFADVRVHSGGEAEQVGALAYTQGADIHFQPGLYDPQSLGGQELLGHELTHVIQQKAGRVSSPQNKDVGTPPVNDDGGLEAEADAMGARAARGQSADLGGIRAGASPASAPIQCKGFWNKRFGASKEPKPEEKLTDEHLLPEFSKDGADQGNINSVDLVTYSHNIGSYPTGYFKAEQTSGDLGLAARSTGIEGDDLRASNRAVASSKVDDLLGLNVIAKTMHAEHNGKQGSVSEQAPGRQVRTLQDRKIEGGMIKTLDENPELLNVPQGDDTYIKKGSDYYAKDGMARHNYFDYARRETQKGFNDLQWEDALSGQMDRHGGNIYVDDLTGKVTGIDNDAAFGSSDAARDPADLAKYGPDGKSGFRPGKDGHNRGLPQMIDADTAQRFKDLNSKDLKNQLGEELSKEEVEATLQRLKHIKSHIKGLEKSGMVVGAKDKKGNPVGQYADWDKDTLEAEKRNEKYSYLGHVATSYDEAADPRSGREAEKPSEFDQFKAMTTSDLTRRPQLIATAPAVKSRMTDPVHQPNSDTDVPTALLMHSRMNDPVYEPNSDSTPATRDTAMEQLMSSRMNDSVFAPNSSPLGGDSAVGRSRSDSGPYGVPIPAPLLPNLADAPALGGTAPMGRPRALSGPYGVQIPAPSFADAPALGGPMAVPQAPKGRIGDRLRFFEELARGGQ